MYANILANINDETAAIPLVPHTLQFAGFHRSSTDCMVGGSTACARCSMLMIVYNAIYLCTKLLCVADQYVKVSTIASMIRILSGI